MNLSDLLRDLDLPPTTIAEQAWDRAEARSRRRRTVVIAAAAGATVAVLVATMLGDGFAGGDALPPAGTPATSAPTQPGQPNAEPAVDGSDAIPKEVVIDPENPDQRAVRWWSCNACRTLENTLVLTDDAFETRMLVGLNADTTVAYAGDDHVALVDWAANTVELVAFDGTQRTLKLGATVPAPPDSELITSTIGGGWRTVWIDTAAATAHPVPPPPEQSSASLLDDSMWRDANGLVWFGTFTDGTNTIATSADGGVTWRSHELGTGRMVPASSAADGVLAVMEYEDANREQLRLLRVRYSTDGGNAWTVSDEGSTPEASVELGGIVRADERLLIRGRTGLLVMEDWRYFAPAAWTPGRTGGFELLGVQGSGDELTVTGRPTENADVYFSSIPGDDWTPLRVR